jgi:hypothetical protein
MEAFNWNPDVYTQDDLEEMFQLNYLPNYQEQDVQRQVDKVAKKILIKKDTLQIRQFFEQVKKRLLGKNGIHKLVETYESVYNINKNLESSEIKEAGGTMIIQKPVTPYGQSQPSEFYQGTLNPLNPRILRKSLNIDTKFRENYYATQSTNFHLDLPIRFSEVVSIQLTAMELPITFYNISKTYGNNYFWLKINGGEYQQFLLPDGSYTFKGLTTIFNNSIFSTTVKIATSLDGTPSDFIFIPTIIQPVVDTVTSLELNFQLNNAGQEDKITPLPLKLGWLMGFRQGRYINNTTYVSEGIADFNSPKYLYLVVDDYHTSVNDGFVAAFNSSLLNKNILARISLNLGINSTVLTINPPPLNVQNNLALITYPRQYFGPVNIEKLQIQLLDEYGRIVNLNNMDYSFCLTMQTIYNL